MEINDLVKSLEIYDKKYKRNEIDEALMKREEITPHLLAILEKVLHNPEQYADPDSNYWGHIYAVMLLGHFCETKAHDIIVDLFSLPNKLPSDLFGDLVTDTLPIVLLRTCGGNIEKIKELILNKNSYDFCRGSAAQALSYAMMEGYTTREYVLTFYKDLFSKEELQPESSFHDILATCVYDIYPEELMDTIEKAYDEEIIFPGYIRQENFTEILKVGKEKCLDRLRAKIQERQLDNIHDNMSWWACFDQPEKSLPGNSSSNQLKSNTQKSKKINKSKRKQSKASRKENRKKKK